jgi:hypothetical protein
MRTVIILILIYLIVLFQTVISPVLGLNHLGLNFFVVFLVGLLYMFNLGEVIFFSVILGLVFDSISVFSGLGMLYFIGVAVLFSLFISKTKEIEILNYIYFSIMAIVIFNLLIYFFSVNLYENFGFFAYLKENLVSFLWFLLKAILANSLILVPIFYLLFRQLQEFFDYWEQRKKM